MEEKNGKQRVIQKEIRPFSGGLMLPGLLLSLAVAVGMFIRAVVWMENEVYLSGGMLLAVSIAWFLATLFCFAGLRVVNPKEALVLTLFGRYYGTILEQGFYFVNPFCSAINPAQNRAAASGSYGAGTADGTATARTAESSKKISTKVRTLDNAKQKVNDVMGNPIIIGAVVIWNVENPTDAVFSVDNYIEYLSIQCDSTIRNTVRLYPYDTMENDTDEMSLRGSSQAIADSMKEQLQKKVEAAGLYIEEVRITHLSYAEEIAAAMLQRQQAEAVIAARQKIVEGAVSMVKMAIDQLSDEEVVVLDEERKAAMVSNLLVVLCGNKDAQPIVNSGSLY